MLSRQQRRRIEFKVQKAEAARQKRNRDTVALAEMRAARQPWMLPDCQPGKLLLTPTLAQSARGPGSRRGRPDRRVLSKTVQVVPAMNMQVGRRLIELAPERRYEVKFHATKGRRCERLPA
jgi:hypothetical protein